MSQASRSLQKESSHQFIIYILGKACEVSTFTPPEVPQSPPEMQDEAIKQETKHPQHEGRQDLCLYRILRPPDSHPVNFMTFPYFVAHYLHQISSSLKFSFSTKICYLCMSMFIRCLG